jgi:hypothetical protein
MKEQKQHIPEKQYAAFKKEDLEQGVQFYVNKGRLKLLRNVPLGQKFIYIQVDPSRVPAEVAAIPPRK